MDKRTFLQSLAGLSMSAAALDQVFAKVAHLSPNELAEYADFWATLRRNYRLKPDYINFENGYYSMQSQEMIEAFVANVRETNYHASYYMRTRMTDDKVEVRKKLAALAGCSHEEVIVTRNTTESMDTVIAGFDWKAGDEAVMAVQDYGAMLDMFKLQARRYGIVNKVVSLPLDPQSDDEIVQLYENAITPKTRLLMICHMVNITGHILPVRKICDMAHRKGVQVMVDGAHAFAHLDFKIPDLNCDYYGTSLHKWLGCPLGVGMLYVRKDNIGKIWQMFGDMGFADDDIRKLNHTGTNPVHTDISIPQAITFHEKIGSTRKEARLRYLQQYWTTQVRHLPNINVNTPSDPSRSCAIANVGITHIKPADLAKTLLEKFKIWTVAIDYANVHGVRITPHLYTTTRELDTLVNALKMLSQTT